MTHADLIRRLETEQPSDELIKAATGWGISEQTRRDIEAIETNAATALVRARGAALAAIFRAKETNNER